MHVADVTMFYAAHSGGIRRYLDTKHEWLERRRCRHTLVVPARNGCAPDAATCPLPSIPLPLSDGYRLPVGVSNAARALVNLRPQLIEAGDPYHLAWAALRARDTLHARAVAFCHSDVPRLVGGRYGARAERLASRYFRRLYRQFDAVLAPSAFLAAKLAAIGLANVAHQPLGVDTAVFTPAMRSTALRAELGAGEGTRLLVYAGRFAPEKNLGVLIEAVEALGPPYALALIGSGVLPDALPANVRVLPFVGGRAALAGYLASGDAFVHPGDQETFGLAALEAMACGVPVVGAKAAGVAEIVADGGGILVEPRNADALVEGIVQLFFADRDRLRAEARRTAERYAWNPLLEQMLARYRTLAA